jgi:acyl-CoA dehydrogenase
MPITRAQTSTNFEGEPAEAAPLGGTALSFDLQARIDAVVAVAKRHAEAVDRDARFPKEACDELRGQRLLGLLLPSDCGGEAATISDVAQICYALGRACSSTSMIFAMHSANIACVARHADSNAAFLGYLRRIGLEQLLVASSTTEGQNGANVRSSAAPIVWDGDRMSLSRDASVVSYGFDADAIVSTARRSSASLPTDQVLTLLFKDQYALQRTARWDALGMRGTCSDGFKLDAVASREQVLAEPYERIHRHTMMPATHLLWAACWAGVAAGAVERAQMFVRKVSRAAKGAPPPGAPLATQAYLSLMTLINLVDAALADFERRTGYPGGLEDLTFQTSLNLLKVSASELSIATVMHAFNACGIAGYRNDGEFSLGRSLRDILSTSVMINNNRILSNVAAATLLSGVPERLGRR